MHSSKMFLSTELTKKGETDVHPLQKANTRTLQHNCLCYWGDWVASSLQLGGNFQMLLCDMFIKQKVHFWQQRTFHLEI